MDAPTAEGASVADTLAGGGLPLTRVLIVDDHPFFSDGLGSILLQENLAREVGKVISVHSAILDLQTHPRTSLVLLDLTLQGEVGLSLFGALDKAALPVPVVVISSREDETSVRAARAAGALGFMPKSSGRHTLARMMRSVSAGHAFYPALSHFAVHPVYLTPRQHEVLTLLADGLPNKRICQVLGLTEHTVKTHLKAVFTQLGVHSRTECVAQARALGLI